MSSIHVNHPRSRLEYASRDDGPGVQLIRGLTLCAFRGVQ